MKKTLVMIPILLLFIYGNCFGANSVEMGPGFLHVTLDASTDFVWSTATITGAQNYGKKVTLLFPGGLPLTAIKYQPPAAAAVLIVNDQTITGPVISQMTSAAGDTLKEYFPGNRSYKPCIGSSGLTTPTGAQIWFEY